MAISAAQDLLSGFGRSTLEQDFERMYQRHAPHVFRYALLVLRSRPDAEDVTQATFLRAYRAIAAGERVRKPQHWLITIAHNECRRHLRSASRRQVEIELDESLVSAPEPLDGPSAEEIRDALEQLSFNQRAALVMRELEDRSYAEIAEVLELSTSAVETLLFRARRALREQMEGAVPCQEVEALLLKQLDGEIGPDERRVLRAHTRSCPTCATLERQHRGRKAALKRLGSMITLPSSLGSFFGGGTGAAVATGAGIVVGAKAVAAVVAVLGVATAGAAGFRHVHSTHPGGHVGRSVTEQARVRPAAVPARTASIHELHAADARRAGVGSTSVSRPRLPSARIGSAHVAPPATGVSQRGSTVSASSAAPDESQAAVPASGSAQEHAPRLVATVATAVPAAPVPPPVTVPPVTAPPVPAVTVPAVTVPAVTVPTVTLPPPPPPPPPLPLP